MRAKHIDLTNQRFGQLVVIERAENTSRGSTTWRCRCDCGGTTTVPAGNLKTGNTTSCGCFRREGRRKPAGRSGLVILMSGYRRDALRRGLSFNLTEQLFAELTRRACWYCGTAPAQVKANISAHNPEIAERSRYVYNGIDRVDNTRGYEPDNVVPCCKTCNRAKDTMTETKFVDWVERVAAHLTRRRTSSTAPAASSAPR